MDCLNQHQLGGPKLRWTETELNESQYCIQAWVPDPALMNDTDEPCRD